jgi:hypothetical protein
MERVILPSRARQTRSLFGSGQANCTVGDPFMDTLNVLTRNPCSVCQIQIEPPCSGAAKNRPFGEVHATKVGFSWR